MAQHYELIVIGSGPAGEKAALKAASYGHRVALVERQEHLGGAGAQTGTLPSKTLKETAIYLSGVRERGVFGVERVLHHKASIEEFYYRKNHVSQLTSDDITHDLDAHGVDLYRGSARFVDSHTVEILGPSTIQLSADYILVATGSYPNHPPGIPFDGLHVHDSDTILQLDRIPKSLVVVGAGVIGCEYASIFAVMGCEVTLINNRDHFLTFLDEEIVNLLAGYMSEHGVRFITGANVEGVRVEQQDSKNIVHAELDNGDSIEADMFLYAAGRNGNIRDLNIGAAGLKEGPRETLLVNDYYQTEVPHIYAAGDVIGFPAMASTSMDQGRVAVGRMFDLTDLLSVDKQFPYGIYTIPEVAFVGLTEEECRKRGYHYGVGRAMVAQTARGRIMGFTKGMLKLLYDKDSGVVLGVHMVAAIATELIHFGMLLVEEHIPLNRIISMVYTYPSLHDLYKQAAYDALRQDSLDKNGKTA